MKSDINQELKLAYEFVQFTGQNIFLTGKAGTGKTTFLHNLRRESPKRMVVVAPTGVAAINAGGVTIHSFFQVSFGPQIPVSGGDETGGRAEKAAQARRMNREKIAIIRSLDLLVIDEISMVRADLLDAIDEVLRRYKKRHLPFGGVQVLMIGDLQQLAPVVKDEDWEILKKYYDTPFFFSSQALKKSDFVTIELKHIYRQDNEHFIALLNKLRSNQADKETIDALNRRYIRGFEADEGYITLTTHNYQAKNINETKLEKLKGKPKKFKADVEGDFPEYSYPTEFELVLKTGAQVMFIKNDLSPDKAFFNGKIGKVVSFEENYIMVQCPGENFPIEVGKAEWENMKYSINESSQEIEEQVVGKFVQYPLKLAWAITIHKSQGLTFDKAIIDARMSFAHGQVYVALSRCRSLEGLVLSTPLMTSSVISDGTVVDFTRKTEENPAGEPELNRAKVNFQQDLFFELFDFAFMIRRLRIVEKIWSENSSFLIGNLNEIVGEIVKSIEDEMVPVSGKFVLQIKQLTQQQPDTDSNAALQARLKKAAAWYLEKMEALIANAFKEASFETDNKTIRKSVNEALGKVFEIYAEKKAGMTQILSGFSIVEFLSAKSKSALDPVNLLKPLSERMVKTSATQQHPALYAKLVAWRTAAAAKNKIDSYQILSQKAVQQIVNELPSNKTALKNIGGIGKVKLKKYGDEIVEIVRNYLIDNGMELQIIPDEEAAAKPKINTKEITYNLYREGKSIQKIAVERGLAVTTIESHLAFYVENGQLELDGLVSPEKRQLIARYFMNNKPLTLTDAREALDNKVSFGELRFVKAYMENKGLLL